MYHLELDFDSLQRIYKNPLWRLLADVSSKILVQIVIVHFQRSCLDLKELICSLKHEFHTFNSIPHHCPAA